MSNPPNPKARYGAQKPDLSLIPPVALHHMALAFEEGARKYGAFNWRENAVEMRTYLAAAMRHLCDVLDGTERASDSDVLNLGHTMACCAIAIDAMEQGNLIDNRPPAGKSAEVLERLKAWKIERAGATETPTPSAPAEPYTPRVGDVVRVTATEAEIDSDEYAHGEVFTVGLVSYVDQDREWHLSRGRLTDMLWAGMVILVERPQ